MIVVDTNVLAYLFIVGLHTPHAEALLAREPQWAAPVLWRSEFRNILAGYIRQKDITFGAAYIMVREAEALLSGNEFEADSLRVLELVRDSACSAYDCEFVAVALKLDVPIVTMDKALLRGFPKLAVSL